VKGATDMNVMIKQLDGSLINYNHVISIWTDPTENEINVRLTDGSLTTEKCKNPNKVLDHIIKRLNEIGSINFQGGSLLIDLKDAL